MFIFILKCFINRYPKNYTKHEAFFVCIFSVMHMKDKAQNGKFCS